MFKCNDCNGEFFHNRSAYVHGCPGCDTKQLTESILNAKARIKACKVDESINGATGSLFTMLIALTAEVGMLRGMAIGSQDLRGQLAYWSRLAECTEKAFQAFQISQTP